MLYKNKKRGQSAIEWGVLLPLLILIISSVLEMGPLMNAMIVVDKSAQYSARNAAIKGTANEDVIRAYVQNMQGMITEKDFLDCNEYTDTEQTVCKNNLWFINESSPEYKFTDSVTNTVENPETGMDEQVITPSRLLITSKQDAKGVTKDKIEIVPGAVTDRFSAAWVMIGVNHQHRIITPVLQAVLSGRCETGKKGTFIDFCDYFPITKTAIYRVE